MKMKTFTITIKGKVQRVWYRASAKEKALALSLRGRVWNMENGDVAAIVTGDEGNIQKFISWCHEGPPLAKVNLVLSDETDLQMFDGFEITRE